MRFPTMWHFDKSILRRASLETPNDAQSIAQESWNIQATGKGSEPLLVAHTTLLEISYHGSYVLRDHPNIQKVIYQ